MAAAQRKQNTSVRQQLFANGCSFSFFKAVHLLEGLSGGTSPGLGLSPANDPVRFRVEPGFCFPASDIRAITRAAENSQPEVSISFMGLIGPQGILPDWYNEHALARIHHKDRAFSDFLDIFHQRLLSLFYLAWKKYRLAENYRADDSDPISRSLADLVGMGPDSDKREHRTQFEQCARRRLIYFSGLAARPVPTAAAIEAVIGNAVGAPVAVEQFVARMIPVDARDRTCLGHRNGTLQKDALCGGRIRDIGTCFVVRIGPLTWEKYLAFQPHSRNLAMVRRLIARISGIEYHFEIKLILDGPQVPGLCLGGSRGAPLLGRTVLLRNLQRPYPRPIVVNGATGRADEENRHAYERSRVQR
jgi:type VI secretion system protein ImpH